MAPIIADIAFILLPQSNSLRLFIDKWQQLNANNLECVLIKALKQYISFEGGKYKTLLLTYLAYKSEKLTNFLESLASLLLQGASARFCLVK